jgi:hypothetical protein
MNVFQEEKAGGRLCLVLKRLVLIYVIKSMSYLREERVYWCGKTSWLKLCTE